jgi:dihydroneopterin aldolase
MGLIAIEGMQFYAHHGYYKEEQKIGGQYKVDVYLRAKLEEAAQEDILAKTINYENIYAVISEEMTGKSQLIEYVAKKILNRIKTEYENVHHIKIRVSKMNPPLQGNVDRVYVTLEEELEN